MSEPAMSRQATAEAALIVWRKTMQRWNRRSQRANDSVVGRLPVCSLLSRFDEIPAHRHCTVHRAKIARRSEHEVMPRHLLLDSVPSRLARGNDVASQRLDEMQEGDNGPFVHSRHVVMEVVMESDLTCSQGQHSPGYQDQHLKSRVRRERERVPTTSTLRRAQLAAHELSAKYSLRGTEEAQ